MILFWVLFIFLLCLLIGVPVAFSIIIASVIPIILEPMVSLTQASSIMIDSFSSFTLLAIPLFILTGGLLNLTKVTDDIIYISKALVGRVKGSLAQMSIVTSVFFWCYIWFFCSGCSFFRKSFNSRNAQSRV